MAVAREILRHPANERPRNRPPWTASTRARRPGAGARAARHPAGADPPAGGADCLETLTTWITRR